MIGPCATRRHEPAPPPQPTNQHPLSDADLWGKISIEKGRDAGATGAEDDAALAARIAAMSPDQQAMLLIKASRMKPYRLGPGGPQSMTEDAGGA